MKQNEATSPSLQILDITYSNFVLARALYAFAKLGVADFLEDKSVRSVDLAETMGVDPRALYRLLRALSTAGVVTESKDHRFALGPLGEVLRSDAPDSMRGWVVFSGEPYLLQAWEQILHSIQTGQPAWELVHKTPIFEYFEKHPEAAKIFDEAMTALTSGEAPAIISAYDFSGFQKLAEIGGGQGLLLRTILKTHPDVSGILFDQPHVVEGVQEQLAQEGLAGRLEVVPGDFFEAVPAGADAYMLKYVIHDWDDERSLAILKNCRRAMADDAVLLLVETIVPAPGESHYAKLQDLEMMVVTGAQERTADEYFSLLDQAGLKGNRILPTMEPLSILEAVRQ